jgi:hypothetical protein
MIIEEVTAGTYVNPNVYFYYRCSLFLLMYSEPSTNSHPASADSPVDTVDQLEAHKKHYAETGAPRRKSTIIWASSRSDKQDRLQMKAKSWCQSPSPPSHHHHQVTITTKSPSPPSHHHHQVTITTKSQLGSPVCVPSAEYIVNMFERPLN